GDVLAFLAARADGFFPHCVALVPWSSLFLLAGNGARRTFAGAGIGMRALAPNRQALAMAQTAIGTEIHQPLDVHRDFAAKIALDDVFTIDHFADLQHFGIA